MQHTHEQEQSSDSDHGVLEPVRKRVEEARVVEERHDDVGPEYQVVGNVEEAQHLGARIGIGAEDLTFVALPESPDGRAERNDDRNEQQGREQFECAQRHGASGEVGR